MEPIYIQSPIAKSIHPSQSNQVNPINSMPPTLSSNSIYPPHTFMPRGLREMVSHPLG
jgi:hypothetical protein